MYNNFGKVSINLGEARKIPLSLVVYADNVRKLEWQIKSRFKKSKIKLRCG
jgi:hypothetical protein